MQILMSAVLEDLQFYALFAQQENLLIISALVSVYVVRTIIKDALEQRLWVEVVQDQLMENRLPPQVAKVSKQGAQLNLWNLHVVVTYLWTVLSMTEINNTQALMAFAVESALKINITSHHHHRHNCASFSEHGWNIQLIFAAD